MKFSNLLILAILTHGISTQGKAEEISLPKITAPSMFEEGTQTNLSAEQIAELLPWSKNSKMFLGDLLDTVSTLPTKDKIDRLIEGIKNAVVESSPKNSELLMRYVLNRALVINDILNKEMDPEAVGTVDAKLRLFNSSINMALKYYDYDLATLTQRAPAPFAQFGIEYFAFLTELDKSIFDASAQFTIHRLAFEFLQWDLYRDLNSKSYAPQIVKINNGLKVYSAIKLATDFQYLAYLRQLKKLREQIGIAPNSRPPVTNIQKSDSSSRYQYYLYSETPGRKPEGCYAISSNGQPMWEEGRVDVSYCADDRYEYFAYSSTPGKNPEGCYQYSKNGGVMWGEGKVNVSHCASDRYEYFSYSSTPGKNPEGCYQYSNNGVVMWGEGLKKGRCP